MLTIRWLLCRFSRVGQVVLCGDFYQVFQTLGLILTAFGGGGGDFSQSGQRFGTEPRAFPVIYNSTIAHPSHIIPHSPVSPLSSPGPSLPLSPPSILLSPSALRSSLSALRSPLSAQPS